jgi:CDP-4-dehydro-6-deoxyglucose reductase, E1
MRTEKDIRNDIGHHVKEFYKHTRRRERFVPGKSPVSYAGRVYDEDELISLVNASLDFWLTAGRYAKEFEKKLADLLGLKYCLLTNSGSSANLLAMTALTSPLLDERQLLPGDEVITTACGFPTTLNPIIQNNLKPVFIDLELGTYNIKVASIEAALTGRTKAIFIAHTLGNPFDVAAILKITKKYNLWFIEDNCDALTSQYDGKYTGTFGHMSTCSFYPAHHITMGEGGAVLTNDPLLRRIIASLRDWGRDCWCETGHDNSCGRRFDWQLGELPYGYDHKYIYSHIGYNLKITDLQAAIGVAQLKKLPSFAEARKKNFSLLYTHLKRYEKYFQLPYSTERSDPCWFGFPLLVKTNAPFTREEFVCELSERNIATRMLFGGNLTKQPAYKHTRYRIGENLNNTDLVMDNLFWLGVYPGLTAQHITFMCSSVDEIIQALT